MEPTSPKSCQHEVRRGHPWRVRREPCGRPAGHGENGAYCKTHAKQHPVPEDIKERWLVRVKTWGITVRQVAVVSQTEKQTLYRESDYASHQRRTTDETLFDSRAEAYAAAAYKLRIRAEAARDLAKSEDEKADEYEKEAAR